MNPHAIIVGHTGSGKSVLIKATEIFQTLISTSDDILILDPQNEFKEIVEKYGGSYFDLTPKSKIYINGFEVSDAVFYADKDTKEKFIATQTKYAKSLVAASQVLEKAAEDTGYTMDNVREAVHNKYPVYTGTRYRSQQGNKKDV